MSARNTLENKRLRRAERSTKKALPAFIDLVEWVRLRSNVTAGEARRIIYSGALRVDSHKIGSEEVNGIKVLSTTVPAEYRGRIEIHTPDGLQEA